MGENSKRLMKNGYKDDEVKDVKESHELGAEECKSYRMLAARLNFMAQDNPAIQYAAKEICRNMARPESAHFARIKKLARFLLGVERSRWEYPVAVSVAGRAGSGQLKGCLQTAIGLDVCGRDDRRLAAW